MKSSLERVKVLVSKHKEPTSLDFYNFFHLVDNTTKNQALKQDPRTPTSLHLYSNNTQITTTLILFTEPENAQYITAAIFELMNKHEYDYYVIVTEGWRSKGEDPKVYKRGDITNLPIDKKQEILILDGKSKDAKESLFASYEIMRVRPEDDSSQILRFEKFIDSTKRSWLAEQTIKRKWFSSMQEMIDKELETRTEEPPHEVYCCELETKHSDKSITKVMCVIQSDHDALYGAIDSLVAEQKNVLRAKSSPDYVLYMLQLKLSRAGPDRANQRVYWTAVVIVTLVDPEETIQEPYYFIVNDSLKAYERRSDEEYENAECVYKVENLMNQDEMKKLTEWRKARYFDV